ncbi:MAG: DNA methyltransferase [Anaerolineae bacterium]|nr:DNA methyltransferase [Anaerolineae bacterium]MDQ7036476.1 DNA methyltransferase [Anaerolineae bacterium]
MLDSVQTILTVLDPFMSSGTTLFAAYEMGRNAIGIDMMPEYVAMVEEEFANFQKRLFSD